MAWDQIIVQKTNLWTESLISIYLGWIFSPNASLYLHWMFVQFVFGHGSLLWRLGYLEPLAFEEGILERYPIFLSIVLNHVSDDTLEFTYAINCLRLLFEMLGGFPWTLSYLVPRMLYYLKFILLLFCGFLLGYKLWLKTTFSPSVMRNTLLGQCFHTRNEKSHKEIFDIFQPFLQACTPNIYSVVYYGFHFLFIVLSLTLNLFLKNSIWII